MSTVTGLVDPGSVAVVKRFFFAVSIADGEALWEELGEQARAYVLNVAVQQGMDFELGSRLRLGTATQTEWDDYLANLVWGVQRDTDGIDLANLAYEGEALDDGQVRVRYGVPLGLVLPGGAAEGTRPPTIPAGSAITGQESGHWRVQRLVPRPSP
ncbi:hypothetical protein BH23ACT9_BH23ACT9_15590 [soil metagenome]